MLEEISEDNGNLSPGKENVIATHRVIEAESFSYIGGYIVKEIYHKHPHLGHRTENCEKGKSWTEMVSKGHLYIPSEEFSSQLHIMREVFQATQGEV